jgi:hypothetical protein
MASRRWKLFADAEVELARVGPRRERFGYRFTGIGQVPDDLGDEVAQPAQCVLLGVGEPGK